MLYGSLAIISITLIMDFIEDFNYKTESIYYNNYLIISCLFLYFTFLYSVTSLGLLIFILVILRFNKQRFFIHNFNFSQIVKRINSFSLDSLFNFSLYNSNIKGLNLFMSIDNFLVETANHISLYKKISFYLQKYTFNKFLLQINLNLFLAFSFVIIILMFV